MPSKTGRITYYKAVLSRWARRYCQRQGTPQIALNHYCSNQAQSCPKVRPVTRLDLLKGSYSTPSCLSSQGPNCRSRLKSFWNYVRRVGLAFRVEEEDRKQQECGWLQRHQPGTAVRLHHWLLRLLGRWVPQNKQTRRRLPREVKQSYEMLLFIVVNNYNKKNASLTHQVALI